MYNTAYDTNNNSGDVSDVQYNKESKAVLSAAHKAARKTHRQKKSTRIFAVT